MTETQYWRSLLDETKEYMKGLINEALDEIEPLVDAIGEEPAVLAHWEDMALQDPDSVTRILERGN